MITTPTNARMSWVAFATAGVTLTAGAFLIAMFVLEAPYNGPYNFGRANDALAALGNVLIAALVLHVSRPAERPGRSRAFVRIVAAASVVAAVCSILLAFGLIAFEVSTGISIAVILLQASWMLWVNTRLYDLGVFSRLLSRCGQLVGAGLWMGLLTVGISAMFGWLTIAQVLILGLGIFIAGGVWLAWPFWFVMLGLHLRKRPTAADSAAAPATAPDTRRRGRRSASHAG
ncbi:hypothetical protein E3O23_15935 [Cryobacterium tagatosivorans]|uniref:DUF998 domain-containing protein n=2 Tax=Cryobacterium tagatosivorans TaxID=1259199 RepID=A0A4R8UAB0_9MICO|nr:hypothetical protein E3O23_15935 [Cryobacterium tagatosivorans]